MHNKKGSPMTKKDLLKETHSGVLKIGKLEVCVLSDGTRIIKQSSFLKGLEMNLKQPKNSVSELPVFLESKRLKPYISKDLIRSVKIIGFESKKGGSDGNIGKGYNAEILPEVCEVYLQAENDGVLLNRQKHIAKAAKVLLIGMAKVGITALIDEVTGYNVHKIRNEYQEIFNRYIAKEYRPWSKVFPDEFYMHIFRLNQWPYEPGQWQRPSIVGIWTNNIIYERLNKKVLDHLKKMNPLYECGARQRSHHQHLTEDYGLIKLKERIEAVLALMRISDNWDDFMLLLNRAYPLDTEYTETIEYVDDED